MRGTLELGGKPRSFFQHYFKEVRSCLKLAREQVGPARECWEGSPVREALATSLASEQAPASRSPAWEALATKSSEASAGNQVQRVKRWQPSPTRALATKPSERTDRTLAMESPADAGRRLRWRIEDQQTDAGRRRRCRRRKTSGRWPSATMSTKEDRWTPAVGERMPTINEAQRTLAVDDDVDEARPADTGRRQGCRR